MKIRSYSVEFSFVLYPHLLKLLLVFAMMTLFKFKINSAQNAAVKSDEFITALK
jgi:hypothetical protein